MCVDKRLLDKSKECLINLVNCLKDPRRPGFYSINASIYSLMFSNNILRSDMALILPTKLGGWFTNMMWNISRTGAYFSNVIGGYRIEDIINCCEQIIKIFDQDSSKEDKKVVESDINNFLNSLIIGCSLLQANRVYHNREFYDALDKQKHKIKVSENERNDYLRDLYDFKGAYVRGQERQGTSPNKADSGEVDLLICKTDLQPKIYIEGENLCSIESGKIIEHYNKLFEYDQSLYKNNFLISYVTSTNFKDFCDRYKSFFENKADGKIECDSIEKFDTGYYDCENIVVYLSKTKENSINTYHILAYFEEFLLSEEKDKKE